MALTYLRHCSTWPYPVQGLCLYFTCGLTIVSPSDLCLQCSLRTAGPRLGEMACWSPVQLCSLLLLRTCLPGHDWGEGMPCAGQVHSLPEVLGLLLLIWFHITNFLLYVVFHHFSQYEAQVILFECSQIPVALQVGPGEGKQTQYRLRVPVYPIFRIISQAAWGWESRLIECMLNLITTKLMAK